MFSISYRLGYFHYLSLPFTHQSLLTLFVVLFIALGIRRVAIVIIKCSKNFFQIIIGIYIVYNSISTKNTAWKGNPLYLTQDEKLPGLNIRENIVLRHLVIYIWCSLYIPYYWETPPEAKWKRERCLSCFLSQKLNILIFAEAKGGSCERL